MAVSSALVAPHPREPLLAGFWDSMVTLDQTFLTINGQQYPAEHLTSAHLHTIHPEGEHLILLYGMGVSLVPLGVLALGWWLALCGVLLVVVGLWLRTQLQPTYQVLIGLADGRCLTLASSQRKPCQELVQAVRDRTASQLAR
jgi:hypothetical protein